MAKQAIKPNGNYTKDNIKTLEGLEHIRKRTTGYINDTAIAGQLHILKEIVDNCIDEVDLLGKAGILRICIFNDHDRGTYQVYMSDNGRGIPLDSLLSSFTVLNTSGKFDSDAYTFSTGSFGIGAKASAGLSKYFRAISVRPDEKAIGDLFVENAEAPEDIVRLNKITNYGSGTNVILEPDKSIFSLVDTFVEDGIPQLLHLLKLFNIFSDYQIKVYLYPKGVDPKLWKSDTLPTLEYIEDCIDKAAVLFDNTINIIDTESYIKQYFNIIRPIAWEYRIHKPITNGDPLAYDIRAYAVKYESLGGQLSMINSVPMRDADSSHITTVINSLKKHMAEYIQDEKIRSYFLKIYKLPLFLCMNVKYSGANFVGFQKIAFKDSKFTNLFSKELNAEFKLPYSKEIIRQLYELQAEDIESKYIAFKTGNIQLKNNQKMILELRRPKKFKDCNTSDRSKAELFLTEGDSANSTQGRDNETQALYSLGGKPLNPITTRAQMKETLIKLQNNHIYQDIMMITGLTPQQTEFDSLKYGKIFIMTDADTHGKHIVNIIISNLYSINPRFIESGKLYIVTPPFYGLRLKNKSNKNNMIYLRTADDMVNALALNVYRPALKIGILSKGVFDQPKILNRKEFVEFARIVMHIGNMIERLSNQHVIDPIVLEQLTHVSYYLTPQTMNINVIREVFDNPNIFYNKSNNILTISIGRDDIIVSLYELADSMYRELIPFLKRIMWKNFAICVSTNYTDVMQNEMLSIVQLYQLFKSLDGMFKIERWKGLGSMSATDKALTCMNPKYRSAYQITTAGDVDMIFNLLGNSSVERKKLY